MKKYALLFYFLLISVLSFAQLPNTITRNSNLGLITFKKDSFYLKITYGRPTMNNRKIFGSVVPYKKVWRTGDDEATEITLTQPISLAEKVIPAGTYSIFTVPDLEKWTVNFNTELGLVGTYKYDVKKNIFSADFPVHKSPKPIEEFTIYTESTEQGVDIVLLWENTAIRLPMTIVRKK